MQRQYVIIADDLTGSSDSGIQFFKAGYSATVIFDPESLASIEKPVAVLDTETRTLPEEQSVEILENMAKHLLSFRGKRVFYKKIDSTLRGNIAAEVKILREKLQFPLTVFAPSYPGNGRTARDGLLLVKGLPVASTAAGQDPRNPVKTSSLVETLRGGNCLPVRHITIEEIRQFRIPEIIRAAGRKGVFSCDAETDDDLRLIVDGTTEEVPPEDVLWVGSAGMAGALAVSPLPVLLVVGSLNPGSVLQAQHILEKNIAFPVILHVASLLSSRAEEEKRVVKEAKELLLRRKNALLISSLEKAQLGEDAKGDAGEAICRSLASAVSDILRALPVSGLFLTGGEVAVWVVRALGAGGIELLKEVEPGIPLVRLLDGPHAGLPMVTKAGGFGVEETMANCIAELSAWSVCHEKPFMLNK